MIRAKAHTVPSPVEPGDHFLQGNQACAYGAVLAGCDFFAGYPITPSSEIMVQIVGQFASTGGRFVQMEDEIGSLAAVIGAAWAGARAMTATSGPGFSLMMENLGYAIMTETPCVLIDVQRVGPSTGQATRPAQADLMQARWGTHGGFPAVAVCPWSVQEMMTETIRAFNLAEKYRVPVIVLADEVVAHLRERCSVPAEVTRYSRHYEPGAPPFGPNGDSPVPSMPKFGDREKLLVTGSTHDETGFRRTFHADVQREMGERLFAKIALHADDIVRTEAYMLDDAEVVFVSLGFSARSAHTAARRLRSDGVRAGLLRLRTVWPLPEEQIRAACEGARRIVVPEMNSGQLVCEVRRVLGGRDVLSCIRHDGEPITPGEILEFTREAL